MIVDGKKISEEIKNNLKEVVKKAGKKLKLAIVRAGEDDVSSRFIKQKGIFARDIGVEIEIYSFPETIKTIEFQKEVLKIGQTQENTGIIIQLPLPKHINTELVLECVPLEKDVDVLSSRALGLFFNDKLNILPPVVGAIKTVLEQSNISLAGKNIVIIGAGRLVGKPVTVWCINNEATVSVLNENTSNIEKFTNTADILIAGVGRAGIITSKMIKNNVIIIDTGTNLKNGHLVGDVDPEAVNKASLFTPVPGGIGPLTVSVLFNNLVILGLKNE